MLLKRYCNISHSGIATMLLMLLIVLTSCGTMKKTSAVTTTPPSPQPVEQPVTINVSPVPPAPVVKDTSVKTITMQKDTAVSEEPLVETSLSNLPAAIEN